MARLVALGPLTLGLLAVLGGCGGGGGAPGGDTPPQAERPDVVVLFVSGHNFASAGASYLHASIGPQLIADLEAAGLSTDAGYYGDSPGGTSTGGYVELVADLRWIRDTWVAGQADPTEVVVVAHSHGGTWATAAIRDVPTLPIRLQVALDHSSFGWELVDHDDHDDVMGGDPRDRYVIQAVGACPNDDGLFSDASFTHDLEDVVFPNVQEALEVRAGEYPPFALEPYDEAWNVRFDATFTGLACYYSATSHNEVHDPNGTTYPVLLDWVLERLAP